MALVPFHSHSYAVQAGHALGSEAKRGSSNKNNLNTNYCDIMAQDQKDTLNGLSKEQLMDMVVSLQDEVLSLKDEFMKVTNLRLYHLERNYNMQAQYGRRESFEIVSIPQTVTNDELEDEVLDIAKEAKVFVNRQPLKKTDICAVHRLKDGKTTIVRVVNRKFSTEALRCGRNLKDTRRYGEGNRIYINNSFCPEFKFLNFVIRKATANKSIHRYKIRNGITYIQMEENGDFSQIGHVLDLQNKGISIPERKKYHQ